MSTDTWTLKIDGCFETQIELGEGEYEHVAAMAAERTGQPSHDGCEIIAVKKVDSLPEESRPFCIFATGYEGVWEVKANPRTETPYIGRL